MTFTLLENPFKKITFDKHCLQGILFFKNEKICLLQPQSEVRTIQYCLKYVNVVGTLQLDHNYLNYVLVCNVIDPYSIISMIQIHLTAGLQKVLLQPSKLHHQTYNTARTVRWKSGSKLIFENNSESLKCCFYKDATFLIKLNYFYAYVFFYCICCFRCYQ